jgi:N-acetylated-alpha-linked acidic dipeptidase
MTLEPPRASPLSVTFKIVAIVAAFVITAAVIVFNFTDSPTGGKQTRVTSSLWFAFVKINKIGVPARKLSQAEQMMLDLPSPQRLKGYLKEYTSEPHLAGTDADKRQAEWTRKKFNDFGIPDAHIETYYPLLNYPVSHRLAIVSGPEELRYEAKLKEDRVNEDPSTEDPDIVPLFHGKNIKKKQVVFLILPYLSIFSLFRLLQKWNCKRTHHLC